MTDSDSGSNPGDKCSTALTNALSQSALEHAEEACGSKDAVLHFIAQSLGIPEEEMPEEPDANCSQALAEGLDESTCGSFRGSRQWVMCQAWKHIKEDDIGLSKAMHRAWQDYDETCKAK